MPAEVRRKLGLRPGSVVEWVDQDGRVIVRRVGRFTSTDIHLAIFPEGPPAKTSIEEMNSALARRVRARFSGN